MTCLEELLRDRTAAGQVALHKALRNVLLGGAVRAYLPETWVVTTDREVLTIYADADGAITVTEGSTPIRDGAIAIPHDLLAESIRTGKNPPPSSYNVIFYTEKGKAAFEHLAAYFGL